MSKIYTQITKKIDTAQFLVPIYLDTEGESINAFEVRLRFSSNLIFRDYLEKDSIVSYWIEKPHVVEQSPVVSVISNTGQSSLHGKPYVVEPRSEPSGSTTWNLSRSEPGGSTTGLVFSGIIPGGYIGKKGLLVNLVFEAKPGSRAKHTTWQDSAYIEILPSSQVLLNDGLGTRARLSVEKYNFLVKPSGNKEIVIQDNYPPEPFKIYLQRNKEIFNNKYYIIFETKDKQSGIAYYEIAETPFCISLRSVCESPRFEKAQSPYILKDQTLRSYVYVKAVDKVGNERIEVLEPQKIFLINELLFLIIFIFILVIIFNKIFYKLKKYFKF
ncbi:MAG: hypothetical protein KatS3mg095_0774 [Candidatus Parcubacteria bacterium]|nr:MAG: hypothetical protein KatS3mg095_0774 [Candidatus Parcubacteria bacterium]